MTGRRYLLVALVAFLAALAGVVVARRVVAPVAPEARLHAVIHDELKLDAAQETRIEALEADFAQRRRALDAAMRQENRRLAAAIEAEHGYGPQVAAAVDHTHHVMGELQKQTLQHVFSMRAVLRPDQARRYDEAVVKALTVSDAGPGAGTAAAK